MKITSVKNPVIVNALTLKTEGNAAAFLLEGEKFIRDLPPECLTAVFTTDAAAHADILAHVTAVYEVGENVLEKLSGTVSDSKIIAIARKIETEKPEKLILLDGVQDPGNVGTIIRTAAAFGFGFVCGNGTANPFLPKITRAAAGAVSKNYVVRTPLCGYIETLAAEGYEIIGTALGGEASPLPQAAKHAGKIAAVVGSEGQGVSREVLALCGKIYYIPMVEGGAESLNVGVAAGILMYSQTT